MPTALPTRAPTPATSVALYVQQPFNGISVSQFNSQSKSGYSVQQTVATCIGYKVTPSEVTILSIATNPTVANSIIVSYFVNAPATGFATSTQAYANYSSALIKSTNNGFFQSTLHTDAAANSASYLAAATVPPLSPSAVVNDYGHVPTLFPTLSPAEIKAILTGGAVAGIVIAVLCVVGVGAFVAFQMMNGAFGKSNDTYIVESTTTTTVEMSSSNPMGRTEQRL